MAIASPAALWALVMVMPSAWQQSCKRRPLPRTKADAHRMVHTAGMSGCFRATPARTSSALRNRTSKLAL